MKRKMLLTVVFAVMSFACMTSVNAQEIKIIVNGNEIVSDTSPVIENDRTLVPIRTVSEALGCDVSWIQENKNVILFNGYDMSLLWIDKDVAFKFNGAAITDSYKMDVVPKIVNDRTLVPIRCVAELFGAEVSWDQENYSVVIEHEGIDYTSTEDNSQIYSTCSELLSRDYEKYKDIFYNGEAVTKAEIILENGGVIKLDLYNEVAPLSVSNFITLANEGAFDGKIFHRVIKDFMIQGGAFDEQGTYHESENVIAGEFIYNGFMNFIPHSRGVISMARTNDPNSASNQFFIVHKDANYLDGMYAAFGKVYEGMEYVDEIALVETDNSDKPLENQVIKTVRIISE